MSGNLRDTLGELDLGLDDAYCRAPYDIPWWCHFGCVGVGCQGYGNSIHNCGNPPSNCSAGQCNSGHENYDYQQCEGSPSCNALVQNWEIG